MPAGTPLEQTAAVLRELGAYLAHGARGHRLPGLRRHRRADQLQRPGAPVLPARRRPSVGDLQVNLVDKHAAHRARATRSRSRVRPALRGDRRSATAPTSRSSRCRPARRCCRRSSPRSTAPTRPAGIAVAKRVRAVFAQRRRTSSTSTTRSRTTRRGCCCASTGARPRCWASRRPTSSRTLRAGARRRRRHARCTTGRRSTACRCALHAAAGAAGRASTRCWR